MTFDSEAVQTFKESIKTEQDIAGKIDKGLALMTTLLSDSDRSSLKNFWSIKNLIRSFFKEKMHPTKRTELWNRYIALRDEANCLKEIKDEQAAFAIKQVEIAIDSLEDDLKNYDDLIEKNQSFSFPLSMGLKHLSLDQRKYYAIQKELHLLKIWIDRINGLRKELLIIDMRISHKNKILKRLSKLGDRVFPKRKELVKSVSDSFTCDVEAFIEKRFSAREERGQIPSYVVRDEVKALQGFAKILTLNTDSFNKTRTSLSHCWDEIKKEEKEQRLKMDELSKECKENFNAMSRKVEAFRLFCKKEANQNARKIIEELDALQNEMKKIALSREQVKTLEVAMQKIHAEVIDSIEIKAQKEKSAVDKKIGDLKEKLNHLLNQIGCITLEDLEKKVAQLKQVYTTLSLAPLESHLFTRDFADLTTVILNRKEPALGGEALHLFYTDRLSHMQMIRQEVEEYRKQMGRSNLDFTQAMTYRELYDRAKAHLDDEMKMIENLEEKLI